MFVLTDWGLVFLSCLSSDSSQFSASAPAQVLDESAVSVSSIFLSFMIVYQINA